MSLESVEGSVFRSWLVDAAWRFPLVRALAWPVVPVRRRLLPAFVRRGYVEFNRLGSVRHSAFADDFELYPAAELLGTVGTFRGRGALDEVIEELRESFNDVRFSPQEVTQIDDERLFVVVQFSGTGRGSGVKVDHPIAHVWTTRAGGAARRLEVYWEVTEALKAAGVQG